MGGSIQSNDGARRRRSTLFMDGIEEAVGYHHFQGLIALFRQISTVFVQPSRKKGGQFRFRFVRFFSATSVLDGLRVGGVALSVAPARYPRDY